MAEAPTKRSTGAAVLLGGDRPLPHNADAEMAVLGAMLQDPATAIDPAVSRLNYTGSFHVPAHQDIFTVLVKLSCEKIRRAIDLITVSEALQAAGVLEKVGGQPYLMQLINSVPSAANIEHYVEIVHQASVLRKLIRTSASIMERCYDPQEPVRELVDSVEREVLSIAEMHTSNEVVQIGSRIYEAINYMEKLHNHDPSIRGIQTGFIDLDKKITGLRAGEMFVLAARPSIGKTALAMNIVANIALSDTPTPVGVFSLEMSTSQLILRLICSLARVNMVDIRDGALSSARWTEIANAADRLRKTNNILIDDTGSIDVLQLRAKARRMKREHKIGLVVIDYLQLLKPGSNKKNSTRENEVSEMSGGIKALAKELEIPIMVLAQLNRQAEQTGQRPKLSHLRESGAIEQDADVVALLHRDRETETGQMPTEEPREAELIIAKHRNGSVGIVPLTFLPQYTRFESRSFISDRDVPS